jgi:hypothetical protein
MDRIQNGEITDTEFLLELSSGQRSRNMGVQDFIGNLRTIKEKMEEDNEKLQREWEEMKQQRTQLLQRERMNVNAPKAVTSRKSEFDQADEERHETESVRRSGSEETRKEDSGSIGRVRFSGGSEKAEDSNGTQQPAALQGYSGKKTTTLGHLEAENEKLKREFQSMKAELDGIEKVDKNNRASILANPTAVVVQPELKMTTTEETGGKSNKYRTMLHRASGSRLDEEDERETCSQHSKDGYLRDKYAIEECFTEEREDEYTGDYDSFSSESVTTSRSMMSTSGLHESYVQPRGMVLSPLEQKEGARSSKGAYVGVAFSRLREARNRSLYREEAEDDEEEEEDEEPDMPTKARPETYAAEGDVFFDAVDANLTRHGDLEAALQQIQSLGLEMEELRAMNQGKEEDMKEQQQKQESTIAILKDQLSVIVAREGHLRLELAKATEQGDIVQQQLHQYQQKGYEHQALVGRMEELRAINTKLEKKEQRLHQELEASKYQASRQKHAISALERQLGVSSGTQKFLQRSLDPTNPASDTGDDMASQHEMIILDAALDRLRTVEEENTDLREVNRDLSQTKDLLAQVRSTMQQTMEQQNENQASLERQLEGSQAQVTRLKIELTVAKEEADVLRKDLAEAKKISKDLEEARNRIKEIEQENRSLTASSQLEQANLLKQALDGQTLAALLKSQLGEATSRKDYLEKEIFEAKKGSDAARNELNVATAQLVEVRNDLAEHQTELANALELVGTLADENTELRAINCQVEEALANKSKEDQCVMRDLEDQLNDAAAREATLLRTLEESRQAAQKHRRELEEAEERGKETEDMLIHQLKTLKAVNKELEEDKVQLREEVNRATTDAQENRVKAQQLEKTACRTRQEKETVQTKLNEVAYRLQKEAKSHQEDLAAANKRIWKLEDELDSQQEDLQRRCKKIERRAIRDSQHCSGPFF